jgi:hypothetical protein
VSQQQQSRSDIQPRRAIIAAGQRHIGPCRALLTVAAEVPSKQLVAGSSPARRAFSKTCPLPGSQALELARLGLCDLRPFASATRRFSGRWKAHQAMPGNARPSPASVRQQLLGS